MTKKHSLLKTLVVTAGSLYATNRAIDYAANNRLDNKSDKGLFYTWREGEVFYTKQGAGSPLLLVHDLDTISSSYEWSRIIKKLEKKYTVYTIDLLGCGYSDKPSFTYTNYLFVQMITDFVQDVIGEKTSVISSADSSSIIIMANHMKPELFDQVILVNPSNPKAMKMETNNIDMFIKNILFLPLLGTSLYNFYVRNVNICKIFKEKYISNKSIDITHYIDTCYHTAHVHMSNGRFLYASKLCNYTNINVAIGLKDKNNISIIESTGRKHAVSIADAYIGINSNIEVTYLSNSKLLPQLEVPEQFIKVITPILE